MAKIVNLRNGYNKQETNLERLELVKIRGEDDRNANKGKAAIGTLAQLTLANYQKYKKVVEEKQRNDDRRNALANHDNKIVLKGAGVAQKTVNSRKETTEAGPEIQGRDGLQNPELTAHKNGGTAAPSKGLQRIKVVAGASLAKDHKQGWQGLRGKPPGQRR